MCPLFASLFRWCVKTYIHSFRSPPSFLIAGSISFPATLFSRRLSTSPVPRKYEESAKKKRRPKKSVGDYVKNEKPEEGDEYSSKKSESEDNKSIDDEKSEDSVHEQKKEDTFEHSPSASALPFSSDNDGGGDFANDFGDVSPISKAESPAVDASAPKGRTKKRSSAVSAKAKAKPTKQSKTTSKNASSTKNKKRKIDVFDEFFSPETDGGDSDAASESPAPRGKSSSAKKPRKSTPSTKTTSAKKKVRGSTPVSVPKQIRLKSIDPNSASSGSFSKSVQMKKKQQVVARKVKKSPVAVEKKDVLDFSDSPVKPKASAAGRSRKNSASSAKKAPATGTGSFSKSVQITVRGQDGSNMTIRYPYEASLVGLIDCKFYG